MTDGDLAPNEAKRLLARTVVDLYHGEGAGTGAEAEFDRVFKAHEVPTDIAEVDYALVLQTAPTGADGPVRLVDLLADALGLVPSKKEGRRMIEQGAVRIAGERVTDPEVVVMVGDLIDQPIQVGKRRWAKITSPPEQWVRPDCDHQKLARAGAWGSRS